MNPDLFSALRAAVYTPCQFWSTFLFRAPGKQQGQQRQEQRKKDQEAEVEKETNYKRGYSSTPFVREVSRVMRKSYRDCRTLMRELTARLSRSNAVSSYIRMMMGHSSSRGSQWGSNRSLNMNKERQRIRCNYTTHTPTFIKVHLTQCVCIIPLPCPEADQKLEFAIFAQVAWRIVDSVGVAAERVADRTDGFGKSLQITHLIRTLHVWHRLLCSTHNRAQESTY